MTFVICMPVGVVNEYIHICNSTRLKTQLDIFGISLHLQLTTQYLSTSTTALRVCETFKCPRGTRKFTTCANFTRFFILQATNARVVRDHDNMSCNTWDTTILNQVLTNQNFVCWTKTAHATNYYLSNFFLSSEWNALWGTFTLTAPNDPQSGQCKV